MTKAIELMTPDPICCRQTDTVLDAVQIMKEKDVGVVPIVDESQRCVGIVTDRDLCLDVILQQKDPSATPLGEVMHSNLLTCTPEEDAQSILNKMEQRQVKRILVVDNNRRCVGIISEHDLAASRINTKQVGEFVEAVYS